MRKSIKFITLLTAVASALLMFPAKGFAAAPKLSSNEWLVVQQVNDMRISRGLKPLTVEPGVQGVAMTRAREIEALFSHSRPDGTSCFTAFSQRGLKYQVAGENIAAGHGTPEEVFKAWMDSPSHRDNILKNTFDTIGVSHYTSGSGSFKNYWAQSFTGSQKAVASVAVNYSNLNFGEAYVLEKNIVLLTVAYTDGSVGHAPITAKMCIGYDARSSQKQTISISFGGKSVVVTLNEATQQGAQKAQAVAQPAAQPAQSSQITPVNTPQPSSSKTPVNGVSVQGQTETSSQQQSAKQGTTASNRSTTTVKQSTSAAKQPTATKQNVTQVIDYRDISTTSNSSNPNYAPTVANTQLGGYNSWPYQSQSLATRKFNTSRPSLREIYIDVSRIQPMGPTEVVRYQLFSN